MPAVDAALSRRPAHLRSIMPARPARRLYVVRDSGIHGRGVFAAREIRKGTTILEYRGERTTWRIARDRPDSDPDNPHHTFIFELSDGSVIDADVRGNAARWINHSCAPNCDTYEDDEGRVFIEARRTIPRGEEITYDYQLSYDGRIGPRIIAAYACRCGARRCRGSMLAGARRRTS
jgi:SET domain-containing protein